VSSEVSSEARVGGEREGARTCGEDGVPFARPVLAGQPRRPELAPASAQFNFKPNYAAYP